MFIKYGKEQHLIDLMTRGQIYFNPCKYFRDLEKEQLKKGIADCNDGGISAHSVKITIQTNNGNVYKNPSGDLEFILEPCLKIPIFCIKKDKSEIITAQERDELKEQFPQYTHALIIEDEEAFLENVRFNFRNKAFTHLTFYQDEFYIDFIDFLMYGKSRTRFYEPSKRLGYYAKITIDLIGEGKRQLYVDNSNCYKTMFRKNLFFIAQREFRIVLPYEKEEKGKLYQIEPFKAKLCKIDELVRTANRERLSGADV